MSNKENETNNDTNVTPNGNTNNDFQVINKIK
jgi:hypothetical protein